MFPEALEYQFVRFALAAGLLSSALGGTVGTFVVVKRLVFVSGGISHAAFGGVGLAYLLGIDPRLGAAAVAVVAALLLSPPSRGRGRSHDARIGVLWAVGMAVGMVCLAQAPGPSPDLVAYLFGDILAIGPGDLVALAVLTLIVLAGFAWYYRDLVATAFDPAFAQVQGVPVARLDLAVMLFVAVTVVLLIQVVGIILVIALLTIPPLIALRWCTGFLAVVSLAIGLGALTTTTGLAVSYAADLPSGAAIVLVGALLLALSEAWQRLRRRSIRGRGEREPGPPESAPSP